MYLTAFIWAEFILRVVIELREARAVQQHVSVFTLMRLLPLINDFVPLPENREPPALGRFVEMHEQGHKVLHHALLRNLVKVAFALVAIWFLAALMIRWQMLFWEAVLWLHVVAIPFRIFFHFYCWNQEYEADRYALEKTDKKLAKNNLRELIRCEYPHTPLFALVYREHPTAVLRMERLLNR